jgi:lysophospholipase L1-like esterase
MIRRHATLGLLSLLFCLCSCNNVRGESSADRRAGALDVGADSAGADYLALGDSYTIGHGVKKAERWPIQLVEMLVRDGVSFAAGTPQFIAQTGWTTGELAKGIDRASPEGTYQLVTLQIGVNNQYRGLEITDFETEFRSLLERAISLADGEPRRVMVLSIPDWGATPRGQEADPLAIGRQIDAFNDVKRRVCADLGTIFVDITPLSRRATREASWIAPDGLHPSGDMYAAWVLEALPDALEILSRPTRGRSQASSQLRGQSQTLPVGI